MILLKIFRTANGSEQTTMEANEIDRQTSEPQQLIELLKHINKN